MKKFLHLLLPLVLLVTLVAGCKEEPPAINFKESIPAIDTTYMSDTVQQSAQPKNLLIEDFTGVNCPNCPRAQAKAKEISDANPGRVVIVAIHPGPPVFNDLCSPFTTPPHVSKYNFRTEDGRNLIDLLQPALGLPSGALNRRLFAGEQNTLVVNYSNWAAYAGQEFAAGSPVRMEFMKVNFDSVTRDLVVRVKITYTQAVTDTNFLTIGLVESGMIDVQKDVFTTIDDYEHNHVLRMLITSYTGDILNVSKPVGRVIERQYTLKKLNKDWDFHHMEVFAFVNKDAVKREVLQCIQAPLHP